MTNKEILKTAMAQSAEDLGCTQEDFLKKENVVVPFHMGKKARKYLSLPITAYFVTYGSNVVAAAEADVLDIVREYVQRFEYYHLFEPPNMHWLDEQLAEKGYQTCFLSEYYLPDVNKVKALPCPYETRLLGPEDFKKLYLPEWSNALCEDRKELDVLGVGASDQGKLIGLAGCSADCDDMWQIGVDVLPEYRQQGIASSLTSRLALEIINHGKVPFYCSAWSNIRSVRNGVKSGFIPAWAELSVKPKEIIRKMNGQT